MSLQAIVKFGPGRYWASWITTCKATIRLGLSSLNLGPFQLYNFQTFNRSKDVRLASFFLFVFFETTDASLEQKTNKNNLEQKFLSKEWSKKYKISSRTRIGELSTAAKIASSAIFRHLSTKNQVEAAQDEECQELFPAQKFIQFFFFIFSSIIVVVIFRSSGSNSSQSCGVTNYIWNLALNSGSHERNRDFTPERVFLKLIK